MKAGADQALVKPSWHRYRSCTDSTAPATRARGLHSGWLGDNPLSKKDASGREGIEQSHPGGICSLPESQAHCRVSISGGRETGKSPKKQLRTKEGLKRQTSNGEKFLGHHQCGPEKEVKGLT